MGCSVPRGDVLVLTRCLDRCPKNMQKDVGLSILQQLGCHLGKRKKEHKMLSQATAGDLGRTGSLDMGIADFDMTRPSLSNVFTQSEGSASDHSPPWPLFCAML